MKAVVQCDFYFHAKRFRNYNQLLMIVCGPSYLAVRGALISPIWWYVINYNPILIGNFVWQVPNLYWDTFLKDTLEKTDKLIYFRTYRSLLWKGGPGLDYYPARPYVMIAFFTTLIKACPSFLGALSGWKYSAPSYCSWQMIKASLKRGKLRSCTEYVDTGTRTSADFTRSPENRVASFSNNLRNRP